MNIKSSSYPGLTIFHNNISLSNILYNMGRFRVAFLDYHLPGIAFQDTENSIPWLCIKNGDDLCLNCKQQFSIQRLL